MRALQVVVLLALAVAIPARAAVEASAESLIFPDLDVEALRARGPAVLPEMARLYEASTDVARRSRIASAFYSLGWKSPEAKRVLMADVHTSDRELRLNVQWALGRVSADMDVVDVLLDNMQHDDNPLFRDKAACALAHDQIHLTEEQKVYLYERLLRAMRDPKPDVRAIAAKVLEIQTGQTKGFDPNAPQGEREASIRTWQRWLDEYRASL
jgi:HEAT repeat protein